MMRVRLIQILPAVLALALGGAVAHAQGPAASPSPSPGWQATPWADSVMLQSQFRFELESPDGVGVSAQQWSRFVSEVVLPRFGDGLTVIDAYGPGRTGEPQVRLLLLTHPNTPDALAKLGEIATAYAQRFGGAKATRLDMPVRLGN